MDDTALLDLRVSALRCEARDVLWIELRRADGEALPAFTAGSHLEVHLPRQQIRHYSLCNDPRETHRYCIGVGLSRDSRGGSKYLHERLKVGQALKVSAPRNHFPLDPTAGEAVFIAGGIGITPILSMIHACSAARRPWRLFYCARNRARAAFYEDLLTIDRDAIRFHFDDEQQDRWFDVSAALSTIAADAHVYTCGPEPLMRAVEAAGANRPAGLLHFEWFSGREIDARRDRPFTVRLARSARDIHVAADRSLLEALEDSGNGIPYSCRAGLCATCRVAVLAGECEHRDTVLNAEERASNQSILACVSRAKGDRLELDL